MSSLNQFCRPARLLLLCAFIGAGASGCVRERSPVTGKRQAYGMSWNQELEMGRAADQQIRQQYGLLDNPDLQAYVKRVGRRVLAESDLRESSTPAVYRETPIEFQVLDSPVVNAFAIPGFVYVTRGLLAHLENEAQLAVVLGHEIAHIAARHMGEQALKQQLSQLGLAAGAIAGSLVMEDPGMANQILNVGGAGIQLLSRKFSRDDEREADQLGVGYAAAEGYQVGEAAGFFNTLSRLQQRDSVTMPSWLSTHPDPGQRGQTILEQASKYQSRGAPQTVGQDEFLAQIEGLVLGENPQEGFVKNNVFYHPGLRFQFPIPSGWDLKNERAAVIMSPPKGSALLAFTMAPGKNAEEAASRFVQTEKIQVVKRDTAKVNGFDALVVTAQAQTQQGVVGLLNYFIESGDRVYHFFGLAPESQFANVQGTFTQSMTGFSRVTDPSILNAKPARLTVVTADREAPFSTFVPTGETGGLSVSELAILNQVQEDEEIRPGAKLKLPR